ncbi:NTP transferase domain-containing protein [Haloprofundus salilacus]|uniref:NTP transferase domain-containing protein n=1 Tax=Haloprofundus salilacus TaxID=2876190 RepID=UPI001CCC8129|nr:NTP transferase domain-containing protein [Haloprofundus salilacus]
MCGGRGTRLGGDAEKPLVEIGGTPMVDRVLAALAGSRVDGIHAVVSPHAPETREHLAAVADARSSAVTVLDAPGDGYVEDLGVALDSVEKPVVTVAADLPLLGAELVNEAMAVAVNGDERACGGDGGSARDALDGDARSVTVCVPAVLKRRLGASSDTTFDSGGRRLAPTGLNVVAAGDETVHVSYDARLAVNVNRPPDVALAEALCD